MNDLSHLSDAALDAEIATALYFSATAWDKAKATACERIETKRRRAGPLTQGWVGYYQLRRTGLADEIRMYLSIRTLYRTRIGAAETERARRRRHLELAA